MTETDECPRCNLSETTRHLLFECAHSKNIWNLYNNLMTQTTNENEKVNKYDDIFKPCELPGTTMFKAKIIQELIQIERPKNWNRDRLITIAQELMNVERYNAFADRTINKFLTKWKCFEKLWAEPAVGAAP